MPFSSRAEMCWMHGIIGRPISNPGTSIRAVLEGKRREAMMLSQVVWEPLKIEDCGIARSPKSFRISLRADPRSTQLLFIERIPGYTKSTINRRISRPMLYLISDRIGCQSPSVIVIS